MSINTSHLRVNHVVVDVLKEVVHTESVLNLWRRDLASGRSGISGRRTAARALFKLQVAEVSEAELGLVVVLEAANPISNFAESIDYLTFSED